MLNDCNFCNFLILIRKFSRSHCPSGRDKICNSFRIAVKERPKQLQRFCNTKSEVKRVGTLGDYPHLLYQLLLVRYIHHNSKTNKSQVDLTRATRKRSETAGHTPVCEWHCACCDRWWFTKLSVTVSIDLKVGQARPGQNRPQESAACFFHACLWSVMICVTWPAEASSLRYVNYKKVFEFIRTNFYLFRGLIHVSSENVWNRLKYVVEKGEIPVLPGATINK